MIKELRAETLRWLTERVNNRGNCYCDFAPEHDNSETLIAFNITSINPIFDLANQVTMLKFDVEIFINSKQHLIEIVIVGSQLGNKFLMNKNIKNLLR